MFLALTKLLVHYKWSLTQYISILCCPIWWMALSLILLCCRPLELTGTCVSPPACTGLTLWTGGKGRSLDCTAYTLVDGCQLEYCTAHCTGHCGLVSSVLGLFQGNPTSQLLQAVKRLSNETATIKRFICATYWRLDESEAGAMS